MRLVPRTSGILVGKRDGAAVGLVFCTVGCHVGILDGSRVSTEPLHCVSTTSSRPRDGAVPLLLYQPLVYGGPKMSMAPQLTNLILVEVDLAINSKVR